MMPFSFSSSQTTLWLFLSLYCCSLVGASSSSSGANRITGPKSNDLLPLYGTKPDKFVASAPLIVAAVCQNGVVIIATHTSVLTEPLLMEESQDGNDTQEQGAAPISESSDNSNDDDTSSITKLPKDVPLSFRGPFRIQSIDGFGSTLVCAGWRTDGEHLAEKFRSLATAEANQFGEPSNAHEYGRFLAEEASTWMAKCAVYESIRALSCVGLLATSGRNKDDACYLWLVDVTGSYRVRAHAVGLGAKIVNEKLRTIDFSSLDCQEGCKRLLEIMVEGSDDTKGGETKENTATAAAWKLPDNARVEMAVVKPIQRKRNRIRVDSLLAAL